MMTVTQAAKDTKLWPEWLKIKLSDFEKISFNDGRKLNAIEKFDAGVIGTTVDALTRFLISKDFNKSFEASKFGVYYGFISLFDISSLYANTKQWLKIEKFAQERTYAGMQEYRSRIVGLDDRSISTACYLCSFDQYYRRGGAFNPENHPELDDIPTIENVRTFTQRSLSFFGKFEGITCGFVFTEDEVGSNVTGGDGDYLTSDTLWEMKCARESTMKSSATQYIRQLIIYQIMGRHSKREMFKGIKKIGIFNPRSNVAYTLDTEKIPERLIQHVEDVVIGY